MPGHHTEYAFETAIEESLLSAGGYTQGDSASFDLERALFPGEVLGFIQETQPKEWAYLEGVQKDKTAETLLDDLCRALNSDHEGCLSVLRHGFKCFGKRFHVAWFAPASGLNPDTERLYRANRATVARRLRKRGLVEGRFPRLYISARVAVLSGQKARYLHNRGLDESYFAELILEHIARFGSITRSEADELLFPKLPDLLDDKQKKNKVARILSVVLKERIRNTGSRSRPRYIMINSEKANRST